MPTLVRRPPGAALFLLLATLWVSTAGALVGQTVPTPESVLGQRPGDDYYLATYEESLDYFEQVAAASPRVRLVEAGQTSQGRRWVFALVSSPENLESVDRHREIAQRLAHPGDLSAEEARALATEGRAFVHIDGGLHATEVAGAQHTIQLLYDLASATDAPTLRALDDVIVMLWPSANPDGQTMVADWYRSNVGTPFEVSALPRLYQEYVGHDNNRDAYMLNMIESREQARTWREWEPQIIYVHHQSSPFPTRIWLPPFAEPVAPRTPPLLAREVNTIGMAIAQRLEGEGKVGATHMGTGFDAWYPGYVDYMPMLQNIASFWTETALYRYATPHFYTLDDFPPARRDLRLETLYSSPWAGGWWRLRDAVDYMRTASMAVLMYASNYREDLLYNRYQAGRATIEQYRAGPPYAYVVPAEQRDPVAPVELLRRLAFNGVRVSRLTGSTVIDGQEWPAGTWVVPMDQEFAQLARQVLEVQEYPDLREFPDGPPEQPYDAAGWTLPLQMGVRVIEVSSPLSEDARAALETISGTAVDRGDDDPALWDSAPFPGFDTRAEAAGIVPPPGRTTGSGPRLVLDPRQNNAFRALNRAWSAGATVRVGSRREGGSPVYLVEGIGGATVATWERELALRMERSDASGARLARPRIGVYEPWSPSMDAGWTRWLLDQYGFEYTRLRDSDVHAGQLGDRFDVILWPAESPARLRDGFAPGTVPPRYAGGLGPAGLREMEAFIQGGGTLVTFNRASNLAIDAFTLPVRDVVDGLERADFFVSGSLLEVRADTTHRVMAGMPARAAVFVDRSPAFETLEGFEGTVLAEYAESGSPLLSGYLLGEEHLHGKAAALDVVHGQGHVVLIGFRPQWRGQPFGTFRILFNALLYSGDR